MSRKIKPGIHCLYLSHNEIENNFCEKLCYALIYNKKGHGIISPL